RWSWLNLYPGHKVRQYCLTFNPAEKDGVRPAPVADLAKPSPPGGASPMQSTNAGQRHLPIRKDWLAATQEAAREPDRPIIDPHHHLWDRPGNRYLLHDLVEDTSSGHNIRATVFLECREMYRADGPPETRSLGETTFVAGVAAMSESGKYGATRHCAGIIGNVDLRAVGGRARGILEQHVV